MTGLTPRQQAIYDFIVSTVAHHGYPPSYREMYQHLGLRSLNAVRMHLEALEKKGFDTASPACCESTCPSNAAGWNEVSKSGSGITGIVSSLS